MGGSVIIYVEQNGDFGQIKVTNSGEVPAAIRDRFFEKYVTFGKDGGTGLGTYSAWLATKTQGGRIELDTSVSEKTSVTANLPCAPSHNRNS